MATKPSRDDTPPDPFAGPFSQSVRDSAQQIWLAGLGAFSKAQQEGGKLFETLVKEGVALQRKTQSVAEERVSEVTQRMSAVAGELSQKATQQWDRLEGIFEQRVSKALHKLGMPTQADLDALHARLDELQARLDKLSPTHRPSRAARPATSSTSPVRKAAAKRAPARKEPK
ncbi:phasin family protein [Caldimonas aquatica]|uniref:Phasin family protein n=1 Tax=Caldimonas aquatica TaxID=376175 RepID=A0ABY6MTW9_9BURK|nr:phasin family protein [Schlegelella aquatica]UZD55431.1 phasin family protein [Schlegelella aquatica]